MAVPYRCGRLGLHPPHTWTSPAYRLDYFCSGYTITEQALRDEDAAADAAEAQADNDRQAARDQEVWT
jgi:hypothetical protein